MAAGVVPRGDPHRWRRGPRFVAGEVRPLDVELENLRRRAVAVGRGRRRPARPAVLPLAPRRRGDRPRRSAHGASAPARAGWAAARGCACRGAGRARGRYELAVDLVREHVRWFGSEQRELRWRCFRAGGSGCSRGGGRPMSRSWTMPSRRRWPGSPRARRSSSRSSSARILSRCAARFGHEAGEGPRAFLLRGLWPGQPRAGARAASASVGTPAAPAVPGGRCARSRPSSAGGRHARPVGARVHCAGGPGRRHSGRARLPPVRAGGPGRPARPPPARRRGRRGAARRARPRRIASRPPCRSRSRSAA